MRKVTGWVVAVGVVAAVVTGCGAPSKQNMTHKLNSEATALESSNYISKATMTVQMDNSSQTYYVETWYDSPQLYRIALGDANKQINQIIVRNQNGMFIVSPSLQKVFRFNGNWAQNQGHIYLYNQILAQLAQGKDVKMNKDGQNYVFDVPLSSANDVVTREQVTMDTGMTPKQLVLFDKDNKTVVTMKFTDFQKGAKFNTATDFDPHKLVKDSNPAKSTMAQTVSLGFVEPNQTFGDTLEGVTPQDQEDNLLRYAGVHGFTLDEARADPGVAGWTNGWLVDLYGVPGIYTGDNIAHQLIWVNNGVEYSLSSSHLTLGQMEDIAISTFGQAGK